MNCSDLLCSFYLIIIMLIADFIYQDNFVTKKEIWRSSIPCVSIFILSLMFSFLSAIFLTVISISRCVVVAQPLNLLVKKQIFYWKSFASFHHSCNCLKHFHCPCCTNPIIPFFQLLYVYLSLILQILYCPFKIITTPIAFFQVLATLFICICYVFLIRTLHYLEHVLIKSRSTSRKGLTLQLIIVKTSYSLCWIPSNIIYLSSLFMSRYPTDVIIWTILINAFKSWMALFDQDNS